MGVESLGEEGDGTLRVGPVLDHEEVADVVPRRVWNERGAALGRARDRVAPYAHVPTGGNVSPWDSRLSRSHSTATGSKRKYDRGGSGPQVFDE